MRVLSYLAHRSLWFDEAALALNLGSRDFGALAAPLGFDQSAPLLFLWAEKLAIALLGTDEYALRLLPLLAGVATVLLTYRLADRLLDRTSALLGVGLVGFAPMSVYYSTELKPYSLDAAVALVLVLLALDWMDQPAATARRRLLAIAGALAPWCSAAGVFVLAAVGAALWLGGRDGAPRRAVVALAALWSVSFAAAYVVTYHAASQSPYMHRFWGSSYLAIGHPGVLGRLGWALRDLFWGGFVGHVSAWVVAPVPSRVVAGAVVSLASLAWVGARHVARTQGPGVVMLLVGPVAAAFCASAFRLYPTPLRLVLFGVPLLAVLIARGLVSVMNWLRVRQGKVGVALGGATVALVLGAPLALSMVDAVTPEREPFRDWIGHFMRHHRPGDAVYVTAGAGPSWVFYTTDWRAPDLARIAWYDRAISFGGPAFANAPSRNRPVGREGRALRGRYRDWTEVPALSTGIEYQEGRGFVGELRPDSGWLENEVHRLTSIDANRVWLLLSRYRYPAEAQVMKELQDRGAVTLERSRRQVHGASSGLVEFRLPVAAGSPSPRS